MTFRVKYYAEIRGNNIVGQEDFIKQGSVQLRISSKNKKIEEILLAAENMIIGYESVKYLENSNVKIIIQKLKCANPSGYYETIYPENDGYKIVN